MSKSLIVSSIVLLVLLASACSPASTPTPPTSTPIVTETPPAASVAVVQSVEIQILESDPVQVNVIVGGQLPDAGCTTISSVDQVRNGNTFQLTLITTTDPLALCAQALTPFEEVVPLDVSNLPPAEYVVNVNGVKQSFELPSQQDESTLEQTLVEALNDRNFNLLETFMGDPFIIGYWLSEGTSQSPEEAIEQLRLNLLNSSSPITADPDKDLVALLGMDPVTIVGPEAVEVSTLFTSGWGSEGKDEAILFIAKQPDGSPYWHGLLFAKDGFAPVAPTQPQPVTPSPMPTTGVTPTPQSTPAAGTIPTISIVEVLRDDQVTIRAHDYPANIDFDVRMGKIGTQGINGVLIGTINSANGGNFLATFDIPAQLHGEDKIAIRLESKSGGYFSYNWFTNE